jgi:hypothetical protein
MQDTVNHGLPLQLPLQMYFSDSGGGIREIPSLAHMRARWDNAVMPAEQYISLVQWYEQELTTIFDINTIFLVSGCL